MSVPQFPHGVNMDTLDLSTVKEPQIVKVDKDTAIKYSVVEERIDLNALKQEKVNLEAQLEEKEPSEKELSEAGRAFHPYFMQDKSSIQARIDYINEVLK